MTAAEPPDGIPERRRSRISHRRTGQRRTGRRRTGRAQNTGDAFTLVTEEDVRDARSIERFINATIERKKLEGFPYIYSALFDETAQAAATDAVVGKTTGRLTRGMRGGRR